MSTHDARITAALTTPTAQAARLKTARIAHLNDCLRQTWSLPVYGETHFTVGFRGLPPGLRSDFIEALETFNDFKESNDPHHEHDMGWITIEGVKVMFTIQYFATPAPGEERYEWHSEDASNPRITDRVLTVMLTSEY